ncbi:MAG: hypothetical protein OEW68_16830 [Gammaproteobacteria bacterium]|nr:hypothetical protein [Gammaproteobacteria bacterium]MDH4316483.1 hypothetical protein [Gammaproteobacteria bacterium]MDH5214000.1 hypothetical protein [Gammaproteobacteria bacterium]
MNPGLPDQSYLIQKLEGTAGSGAQMPLGGPPIPASTIAFVRQWISDGAMPDPGPGPTTPPVVVAMTPDPDSVLATLPSQVTVAFDQEPDAATINASTVEIRRSVDAQFDNGDDEVLAAASIQLSGANPRLLLIDLSGVTPVEDRYRLTLLGNGANLILNLGGVALDGEFSGTLPSGDGTAGGNFVAEFSVQGIQPTLASIQDSVFTPTCAPGCHTGPPGPGLPSGMDLSSAAASYASLVGVASVEQPSILRVAPSDANASYLIHKIEGTAAVGGRMPLGGNPLPQETIDAIRLWIDQGADP